MRPLFENIWPHERTLRSRVLGAVLAKFPAACGEAFAEGFHTVEPFLMPFDCWSLHDYGVARYEKDGAEIIIPKTPEAANCLLSLLTITIGREENATKPHDLDLAVEHIADSDRSLTRDSRFQRLSALARR